MESLDPGINWLIVAVIAFVAFLFGRASARGGEGGGGGESRQARRLRETEEATAALAALDLSKQADLDRLIADGRIIDAVKLLREATGMGLYESKLAVDERRKSVSGS